jgi:Cyclic nucleotide-binding domain
LVGDIILKRGATIPNFYIILSGQVGITGDASSTAPTSPPAPAPSGTLGKGGGTDKKGISFKAPGDYFGEDSFVKGILTSRRTFVAMNEVTLCVVSNELFDSPEFFGPVKSWIINDINVREEENAVSSMRRKKSYVKFNESGKAETLSQKSVQALPGMPPGILVTTMKRSVSTVDMDENEVVSNDSDVDPVIPEFNEVDGVDKYDNADSLSWLFSLKCGLA